MCQGQWGILTRVGRVWISNKLNVYSWWATLKHTERLLHIFPPQNKRNHFILRTWLFSARLTYTRGLFSLLMNEISLCKCLHEIVRDTGYLLAQSRPPCSEEKLCLFLGAAPPKNSLSSHLLVYSLISQVKLRAESVFYVFITWPHAFTSDLSKNRSQWPQADGCLRAFLTAPPHDTWAGLLLASVACEDMEPSVL